MGKNYDNRFQVLRKFYKEKIGEKFESLYSLHHLAILICVLWYQLLSGFTLWSSYSVNFHASGPLHVLFLLLMMSNLLVFLEKSNLFLRLNLTIIFSTKLSLNPFLICCLHIFPPVQQLCSVIIISLWTIIGSGCFNPRIFSNLLVFEFSIFVE